MGNNSVPKFIFRLSRFPVYSGSVLGRFYCTTEDDSISTEKDITRYLFGITLPTKLLFLSVYKVLIRKFKRKRVFLKPRSRWVNDISICMELCTVIWHGLNVLKWTSLSIQHKYSPFSKEGKFFNSFNNFQTSKKTQ